MADNPKYVTLNKTCVGSLILTVINPVTSIATRIRLASNEPKRTIPVATAALIYADTYGGAYRLYKQGYFNFSDPKAVYDYALEQGLIIGDESVVVQDRQVETDYLDKILAALKSGNRLNVEKLLTSDKSKRDVATVAREHVGELQQSMIKYLEEKLQVGLTVEGE